MQAMNTRTTVSTLTTGQGSTSLSWRQPNQLRMVMNSSCAR